MAKKFQTLEERMSAESLARAQKRAAELLADERNASIHDLVSGMEASFAQAQERVAADDGDDSPMREEELEKLIGDALRKSRILSNGG